MTTHSSGHRLKYGRHYTSDKAGTLHVPMIQYCECRCELCGHKEHCVKTAATGNRYLCKACRNFVVDCDVKVSLSERAKRAAQPQFSKWKRNTKNA